MTSSDVELEGLRESDDWFGSFLPDDLTLLISTCTRGSGGKGSTSYTTSNWRTLNGWTKVSVSRGIERCPSSFFVNFTEPLDGVSEFIAQPGDQCEVYLGQHLVVSGFIDRYIPSYNKIEHTVRIEGRGKCQDLVDCSAYWPGMQFVNQPLLSIAQQLCAVYGIKVALAPGADQGAPIGQQNIMAGESIYEVLERLCRYRALLLYEQPDGSLLLASGGTLASLNPAAPSGTARASSGLQEGVNVESASMLYAMDGRFSDYDALYQGLDTLEDVGDGGNLIARVTDVGVPRFRYKVIISENVTGGSTVAKQRAIWEMNSRVGRARQVRLTTDTWRDSAGTLWTPNTLVDIDLPSLKLTPQTWLISDVTHRRDENGTHADLVIMPPEAFYQEPISLNPIAPDVVNVSK